MVAGLSISLVISGISPAVAQEESPLSSPAGSATAQNTENNTDPAEKKDTSTSEGNGAPSGSGTSDDGAKQSDDLSSQPVGSTDVRTVFGVVVGALAIGGLISAGINWAIQARILPNPFAPAKKAPAKKPAITPAKKAAVKKAPAKKPAVTPAKKAPTHPAPAKPSPKPAPAPRPAPAPVKKPAPRPAPAPRPQNVYYANCKDVWNRLGHPITANDAGYSGRLDRDGDGIACESRPRY